MKLGSIDGCENCHWLSIQKEDLELTLESAWQKVVKMGAFVAAYDDWVANGGFYAQPGEKLNAARKALEDEG